MEKNRIKLDDTFKDSIFKVVEGNPGAITVCMKLAELTPQIDPDDIFGSMGNILSLDAHGIYGSRIWMLFKDVCGESIPHMIMMLRAVQLGFMAEGELNALIDGQRSREEIKDTVKKMAEKVTKRLPKFNLNGGSQ